MPVTSPTTGLVSFEPLPDPNGSGSQLAAQRDFFAPKPSPTNDMPRYPDELLPLGLDPQKIVVRIVIDERGCVAQVSPAQSPSDANPAYEAAFLAAVDQAVKGWRFTPARLRSYNQVDDGSGAPPYRVLKAELPVRTFVDARFIFEVRDGSGFVSTERRRPPQGGFNCPLSPARGSRFRARFPAQGESRGYALTAPPLTPGTPSSKRRTTFRPMPRWDIEFSGTVFAWNARRQLTTPKKRGFRLLRVRDSQ